MGKIKNNPTNENLPKRKPVIAFWNKHRKEILIVTGVVGTIGTAILTFLGVKYYWNATAFRRWLRKASLDEIKEARNNIHSEFMKYTINDDYRESLYDLCSILDKKIDSIR